MLNLFRLCRKDDISRKNRSTLLPFFATKSNVVASTLLQVWTGLMTERVNDLNEPRQRLRAALDVVWP